MAVLDQMSNLSLAIFVTGMLSVLLLTIIFTTLILSNVDQMVHGLREQDFAEQYRRLHAVRPDLAHDVLNASTQQGQPLPLSELPD